MLIPRKLAASNVRHSGHYHSHRNRLGSGAMAAGFRWRLASVQGVTAREFAPPRSFGTLLIRSEPKSSSAFFRKWHARLRPDRVSAEQAGIVLLRPLYCADHRTKAQGSRSKDSGEDTQIRLRYVVLARM